MKLLVKKLLPLLVLFLVVMGCTKAARQSRIEADQRQKQADARREFANKLSNKFELPGSRRCVAHFYVEGEENKTLRVRPCSLLEENGEKIDLNNLLESETIQEAKQLGFTTMETERDGKTVYVPIK